MWDNWDHTDSGLVHGTHVGPSGVSGITGFGGKYMIGLDVVHKRQKAGRRIPAVRHVVAAHHLPAWRRRRAPRGAISPLVFYAVPLDASAYNLFLNNRFRRTA